MSSTANRASMFLAWVPLALASACGGGQHVQSTVYQAGSYDFGDVRTFSIVQLPPPEGLSTGPATWAARYDAALADALRDEMSARGLTEVEAGQAADLAFTYTYGARQQRVQVAVGDQIAPVDATRGKIAFEARDGADVDTVVWSNTVDFFLQEEWPPIDRAERNAPATVADILATFPIAKTAAND